MNLIALRIPEQSVQEEFSSLGEMVGKLAKKRKVKQTDLARKAKISRISVNRFFRGRSEVRATDLLNLLNQLGIDLESQIREKIQE